jgi:hypothetical protein
MGQRKQKKAAFLAQHPYCCFCGGRNPATTEDHVPGRSIFNERRWPEGYVFPACPQCNAATRFDEQVINLISRFYPDSKTEIEIEEFREALTGIANNQPALLAELAPSLQEQERFLPRYRAIFGGVPPAGDLPIVRVSGPIVGASIANYARKLFSALHYKETDRIIPSGGGIFWRWWSNVQALEKKIPSDFVTMLTNIPKLKRQKEVLEDQFRYKSLVSEDGSLGSYMATFRATFAIAGLIAFDATILEENAKDQRHILRPLNHH